MTDREKWLFRASHLSGMVERAAFVSGDVLGLIALDFILRIVPRGAMDVALVVEIGGVDRDDRSRYPAGLRIPAHVVADFERLCHDGSSFSAARTGQERSVIVVACQGLLDCPDGTLQSIACLGCDLSGLRRRRSSRLSLPGRRARPVSRGVDARFRRNGRHIDRAYAPWAMMIAIDIDIRIVRRCLRAGRLQAGG